MVMVIMTSSCHVDFSRRQKGRGFQPQRLEMVQAFCCFFVFLKACLGCSPDALGLGFAGVFGAQEEVIELMYRDLNPEETGEHGDGKSDAEDAQSGSRMNKKTNHLEDRKIML